MSTFTQLVSNIYKDVVHLCGEVGHSRGEVGRIVPVLPMPTRFIPYSLTQ